MTANPRWREVQASLAFGQRAEQRPDIIARVFHAVSDVTIKWKGSTALLVRVHSRPGHVYGAGTTYPWGLCL